MDERSQNTEADTHQGSNSTDDEKRTDYGHLLDLVRDTF